ncbi:glycosyltransferase family 4 protein, partial [Pirellulales bacterium]|nr:glycosyltransferase family 4 protein [Pirellulales bacterium]
RAVPEATLEIVGRRPVAEVLRLAESDSTINVIPDVPDVRPHIAEADLFVVPLRIGGGTRIKIYEAAAMGRPVVATSVGAEGLSLENERQILIADTSSELAGAIERLLTSPDEKQCIAEAGAHFVRNNCSWDAISQHFYDLCLTTTSSLN